MSHAPLQRGPITKAVLAAARSTDFPAEVSLLPKEGGWRDGAPAGPDSVFTPYTVITPQTASFSTGALDYGQDDWHLPYGLNYYAIQNTQIEDFADQWAFAAKALGMPMPAAHVPTASAVP